MVFQGLKDTDGLEVCKAIEIDNFEKLNIEIKKLTEMFSYQ